MALSTINFNGQDCLIVLPTGHRKSLICQMLSSLFDKFTARGLSSKDKSTVIVSPLNALINEQINRIKSVAVNCTSLRVCGDKVNGTFEEKILELHAGKLELVKLIIFTHPEVLVSNMQCRYLFVCFSTREMLGL